MAQTTHPENRCPKCGHRLDRATGLQDDLAQARPGDLSLCIACGEMLVFEEGLLLRSLAPEEFNALESPLQAQLVKTQLVLRAARRTFGRN